MKKQQQSTNHFLTTRRGKQLVILLVAVGVLAIAYVRYSQVLTSSWAARSKNAAVKDCQQLPLDRYKAWRKGVVTEVQPAVRKDCVKLLAGDMSEQERVKKAVSGWKSSMKNSTIYRHTADCSWLAAYLTDNLYNSELEMSFPIAFSFIVYESPEQFLRLFKLLYRPQNAYCIHCDKKSNYKQFFSYFAKCLPNVVIPNEATDVAWGQNTLLMAQMSCLSELVSYRDKQREEERWRYVINLCSKELPLISTRMIVEKLISMNETSSVVSWAIPDTETHTMERLRGHTLPHHLSFYKSMTYNALSAPLVYFLLQNSTATDAYKVFVQTFFPEEHFYATLFRVPGVPGGYDPQIPDDQYFEVGHYFWRTNSEEIKLPCYGKTVHGICIVNYADLPRVMEETKNGSAALFQNKYFMEHDHIAMDCMEERIVDMNKREFELECGNS